MEYQPSLFNDSPTPAGGADYGPDVVITTPDGTQHIYEAKRRTDLVKAPTNAWWLQQFDKMDLPEEIRKVLPQVSFFATTSVLHGTPEWMASALMNTVYAMIDEVHKKRIAERLHKPATTVEESEERLRALESELARVRAAKQAMESLLVQAAESEEAAGDPQFQADLQEVRDQLNASKQGPS
ncbi:hypothetical protein ABT275_03775 [Streptomyces sp. NPDC001185]|uniref:hypothetical protein n=1 Tax=Streptomyces sp. NPDC001185 TaxID=3154380 RepID=UPI003330BE83